jgi:catechol 2,3-dioxygenase-like lactoylglutathione lyase family enzyme
MAQRERKRDDSSTAEPWPVTAFREAFPVLYVDDVAAAADRYVSTLGFEQVYRFPPDGEPDFAFLKLEPLGIALSKRAGYALEFNAGRDFELCIYADDVDAAASDLRANGFEEVRPPTDEPWGERMAYFRDPDGHLLQVTAKL